MSETNQVVITDPATSGAFKTETEIGSVFVSNYPAYSFWSQDSLSEYERVLQSNPNPETPLGLYIHIPFCRKRCKFCYFKVYTGKNSSEIQTYLDALSTEIEVASQHLAYKDRNLKFVYFGGGTPSFISAKHLCQLVDRAKQTFPWQNVDEVAFECEPGTLTQTKLEAIKEIGVTRLSLGIENFNDTILQENGRAHVSKEIFRVSPWIKELEFAQVNIDLIAGMVGETWDSWKNTVQQAIDYDADSVTIYQMELPFNTVYSKEIMGEEMNLPVATWDTKRDWHQFAIEEFIKAGYEISSAYTLVKKEKEVSFVYRDALWSGSDMLSTGVASFGHLNGVHYQNSSSWNEYIEKLKEGELPINRAFSTTARDRMIRELILQTKSGLIKPSYFRNKFDVDILSEFSSVYHKLQSDELLNFDETEIKLTRKGLLRVDGLLPLFYDDQYRNTRYT